MREDSGSFIDSVTSSYAMARSFLARLSKFVGQVTFKIKLGTQDETIAEICRRRKLDDKQRQFLIELASTKAGTAFINEKVQDINRGAFHRSAFALNALTQLGFVDLAAQLYLTLPQLKLALVVANLILAWIAHASMRKNFRALLAGPNALPPKRFLWGLFRNRRYNKAVKKSSRPYAQSAWKEKSIYRPAYFLNALSIFLGSQFIIPPEKLIFPLGLIVGKLSGLFSTLVMAFDVWRGVRAGDDARMAREREISVYRDLDIRQLHTVRRPRPRTGLRRGGAKIPEIRKHPPETGPKNRPALETSIRIRKNEMVNTRFTAADLASFASVLSEFNFKVVK